MKKRYSRIELIKMVAEKTGYHQHNVAEIHTALEEIVNELLLSADENSDVEIRLFFGLGLYSTFIPKRNKRLPNKKIVQVDDHLRFQAKFSDAWKDDKNYLFRETRKLWERVTRRKTK